MDIRNPYEIAAAIAELDVWDKVSAHNWALVPQTSEEPYIVSAGPEKDRDKSPVAGRLLLFPGLENFRNFAITRQAPEFGVWMSPLEFRHWEVIAVKKGPAEIFGYVPGYVPQPPSDADKEFLAPLLYECLGVLMRIEEDPQLPLRYFEKEHALFARKEVVDGVWQDGPLHMPPDGQVKFVERVSLDTAKCRLAAKLPVVADEKWEVDFVMVPAYHTREPKPRFLYVLAAVDAATGVRVVWLKMSVGGTDEALKALWEGHAARLLEAMLRLGRAPGEIHVRSGRVARFLRPLGMHVPFKLVHHAKLGALDAALNHAAKTNSF